MAKKKTSSDKNTPLLIRVMAALGGVKIREQFIRGDAVGEIVYGQCIGTSDITINPVPAIVEVVLHECIHAVHPEWSERTVRAQTSRLFHRLSEAEMKAVYEVYKERIG